MRASFFLLLVFILPPARAAEPEAPPPDGSAEAKKTIAGLRLPSGVEVTLFAAEPQLGAPVAIGLDEKNRVFVAEEYRFNRGTEENRTRPFVLEDDLQIRTLDDRLASMRKWQEKFPGKMDWFTRWADQVRLVEDRDGDGRADRSTIFAKFNEPLDGLAAGVMVRDGDVFVTCIPHLWRLRDDDGDGVADVRQSLHRGFGVNYGFLGHDLHGLCWGPDGRLYFSIGDRGYSVTTKEGKLLESPRNGAVFRCDPDGSHLEVVHRGLRNPQELAFDEFGNLFADDNNCDKGDHARLVYVVEGGDSGWNMSYQTIPDPYLTGPWHAEKLWHLPHPGQPAYLTPPVGKIGNGPSGFCYYSHGALPEKFRGRFFMANYTGNGGIEAIAVKPSGAGFEITSTEDFLKPLSATDCEIGYDGQMYVSDFVQLIWDGGNQKGRIFAASVPALRDDPQVKITRETFREGFAKQSVEKLAVLLEHPDYRLRQRAQFELAARCLKSPDDPAWAAIRAGVAAANRFTRLHATWALWQLGRALPAEKRTDIRALVIKRLADDDAEVRAQAVKVLGEIGTMQEARFVRDRLEDPEPRVVFFALQSLGRLGDRGAIEPILALVEKNSDKDLFLRHAAVVALERLGDWSALTKRTRDPAAAVRLVALLVLRRAKHAGVTPFLHDAEPRIVAEAARAIHDVPIEAGQAELAALLPRVGDTAAQRELEPLCRRAIAANFRLGGEANAKAIAEVAVSPNHSEAMRREALSALADWAAPPPRDRVNWFWRPLAPRDAGPAKVAVEGVVGRLLAQSQGKVLEDATKLLDKLQIKVDGGTFLSWIGDAKREPATQVAALQFLAGRNDSNLDEAIRRSLASAAAPLRSAAREAVVARDRAKGLPLLLVAARDGELSERQSALAVLAKLDDATASQAIGEHLQQLRDGKLSPDLALDVVQAAKRRNEPSVKESLAAWEKSLPAADPLAKFRIAMQGGDAERGKRIFVSHARAQCVRCHQVEGQGGDAGPDLSKVAMRGDREHLLQSLIQPSAKIAAGFGTVTLQLDDGRTITGVLQKEEEKELVLLSPRGETLRIEKSKIEERSATLSPMPPAGEVLLLEELRDLMEFLARRK